MLAPVTLHLSQAEASLVRRALEMYVAACDAAAASPRHDLAARLDDADLAALVAHKLGGPAPPWLPRRVPGPETQEPPCSRP